MDILDIQSIAVAAGLNKALAVFPDEVARAAELVVAQRALLRAYDLPDREKL